MKIVVDAGHGPQTPGKRTPDDSMREFHFNSVVARYVRTGLLEYEGVQTMYTHADDGSRDVTLKDRTAAANKWGADLLVSIHANAMGSGWGAARGIETFVYTTKPASSVAVAKAVQRQLIAATGLFDRGVKAENLHMVRESHCPAILVECGFMTNRTEAELLKSDVYRRKCAAAIVAGIAEACGLKKKGDEDVKGEKVTVKVDGVKVADGVIEAGVTYVPARQLVEAMGGSITFDVANKVVQVKKGDK